MRFFLGSDLNGDGEKDVWVQFDVPKPQPPKQSSEPPRKLTSDEIRSNNSFAIAIVVVLSVVIVALLFWGFSDDEVLPVALAIVAFLAVFVFVSFSAIEPSPPESACRQASKTSSLSHDEMESVARFESQLMPTYNKLSDAPKEAVDADAIAREVEEVIKEVEEKERRKKKEKIKRQKLYEEARAELAALKKKAEDASLTAACPICRVGVATPGKPCSNCGKGR